MIAVNDLLKLAIEGLGGLPRWEQVSRFGAAASVTSRGEDDVEAAMGSWAHLKTLGGG